MNHSRSLGRVIGQTPDRRGCDEDQAGLSGACHYRGRGNEICRHASIITNYTYTFVPCRQNDPAMFIVFAHSRLCVCVRVCVRERLVCVRVCVCVLDGGLCVNRYRRCLSNSGSLCRYDVHGICVLNCVCV